MLRSSTGLVSFWQSILTLQALLAIPADLAISAILAKESADFSARIAVLGLKHRFKGTFRDPRTK